MNLKRKEKKSQSRRLGKYLKEQKGRIYIIRRCVMMLLCSRDWFIYSYVRVYMHVWVFRDQGKAYVYTYKCLCPNAKFCKWKSYLLSVSKKKSYLLLQTWLIVSSLSNLWSIKQRFLSLNQALCAYSKLQSWKHGLYLSQKRKYGLYEVMKFTHSNYIYSYIIYSFQRK